MFQLRVLSQFKFLYKFLSLVEMLLETRQNAQNAAALAQNNEINQALNLDDSASDASDSGSDNVDDSANNTLEEFENPLSSLKQNAWLSSKLSEMIELNRRFVLEIEEKILIHDLESIWNRAELVTFNIC